MDVDFVPPHLVIVGGSYIGLEFAQMYRRFGSAVTVIEMSPRLIGREDEDTSEAIRDIFEREGISVRTNAKCIALEKGPAGVRVGVDCTEGSPKVDGSHLLLAVGRRPNTDDLGLEKAGVTVDARGYIGVDDQLRTNVRRDLGARRLQRPRRLYAHGLQRLRDRGREPAGRRSPPRDRPHRDLRALHRPASGKGRPDRGRREGEGPEDPGRQAPDDARSSGRSRRARPSAS